MKQLAWLVVAAVLFSGCTGSEDPVVEPTCDEMTQYMDAMGECITHVDPTIVMEGLPASMEQFESVDFAWTLDNGTRQAVHSMDSRILASMTDDPIGNETGPDDWGTQVVKEAHKDLPEAFNATFTWDEVGTVYLKGYMLIDAKNVWVDLGSIDVTAVSVKGERTTITASGTPAALDTDEVTITVGQGVTFQNELQYELVLSWDCNDGTAPAGGAIAGGSSMDIDFTVVTSCDFLLSSPLAASGNDFLALDGKVVVLRP